MMTTTTATFTFWSVLSLVGSMAVMGPAGALVGAWLALGKHTRLAMNWVLLFCAGMVVVVVTKLAFMGWGVGIASISFAGFSGHAMFSAAIYPMLAHAFTTHLRQRGDVRASRLAIAAAYLFAAAIAYLPPIP